MIANWILDTGTELVKCDSFPYAFRSAYNMVKKASETKGGNVAGVMKRISIQGPPRPNGDRRTYNYTEAAQMATAQGLLTPDGTINSREFKRK